MKPMPRTPVGRAGFVAEDLVASSSSASGSRVESALTSAATFQHRQISFVRPQNPSNARPASVSDGSANLQHLAVKSSQTINGTTVTVSQPKTEKQDKKDDFKMPSVYVSSVLVLKPGLFVLLL